MNLDLYQRMCVCAQSIKCLFERMHIVNYLYENIQFKQGFDAKI